MVWAQSYLAISMAKLLGEPGKTSLKFCSGTGIEEIKQEFYLTNCEAAAFLRDLAQQIEAEGKVEIAYGSLSISVHPILPIKLEVEYEKNELEIEIKFKEKSWNLAELRILKILSKIFNVSKV